MTDENKLLKAEVERLKKELSLFTPSLALMLERKGFIIYKKEPSADLLVPYRKFKRAFYEKLKKYSFRLFLRDVIKHQDSFTLEKVTKYATKQVSAEYLDFLLRSKIAEEEGKFYRLRKLPVKSFGVTLEWFVAELMRNDMHADVVWGVKFKRPKVGGDYDILAKIDSSLLYMEIKSSPPKQIYDREITSFLNRTEDLSPDIAIFFVDTELRMKDKIVPMFEDELKRRYKRTIRIDRLVKELFHINGKIFIINAKDSISANIQTVMTFVYHKEFEIT
jgi:hypothetical protein